MQEVTIAPINMRVPAAKRILIDIAAIMLGKSRTEFVMSAACERAESVLLNQRDYRLNDNRFERFEAALEQNPMQRNAKLKALLSRPKHWA